jgi:hypothetical protein
MNRAWLNWQEYFFDCLNLRGKIPSLSKFCRDCKLQIRGNDHFALLFQSILSRSALLTTETELSAIAAAANIGFSRIPKNG